MLNVDASDVRLSSHFWSVSCVEGLSEAECSRESVCVLRQCVLLWTVHSAQWESEETGRD